MKKTPQVNVRQLQQFWQMEDNFNNFGKWKTTSKILANGRRPKFFGKWKTTSIFGPNGKQNQLLGNKEENLNFYGGAFMQMEDDLMSWGLALAYERDLNNIETMNEFLYISKFN